MHLARGEHGRALAAYLTLAREAAVSGPGRAYRSLTPAILSRAERCRRPLAERFRRDLADTLRSYAAAAASVGARVNPHENQRAALALGACFWLANDLERSSDVRPGWRPVESVLAEHVETVERDVTRAFKRRPGRRTEGYDDDDESVHLSAILDALAAVAEWQTALVAALPERPHSSALARLYAEPGARAAGRALDATLEKLARNGDDDDSNTGDGSNPRAFDRALRVVGRCVAACGGGDGGDGAFPEPFSARGGRRAVASPRSPYPRNDVGRADRRMRGARGGVRVASRTSRAGIDPTRASRPRRAGDHVPSGTRPLAARQPTPRIEIRTRVRGSHRGSHRRRVVRRETSARGRARTRRRVPRDECRVSRRRRRRDTTSRPSARR